MRSWLAKADALSDPEPRTGGPNELRVSPTLEGRHQIDGTLDADRAANLTTALGIADSADLDYGRQTREWAPDLYNAIVLRDQGCRYPGCDRPATWCDVHHIQEWDAHHGPTSIDNGVMLCRHHHRRLHHHDSTTAKL